MPAGRLHHRLARLEVSGVFGGFDHPDRQTVLDRAEWIEGLDFDEQINVRRASLLILTTGVLPTVSRILLNLRPIFLAPCVDRGMLRAVGV
jgi:hypothetical protein